MSVANWLLSRKIKRLKKKIESRKQLIRYLTEQNKFDKVELARIEHLEAQSWGL